LLDWVVPWDFFYFFGWRIIFKKNKERIAGMEKGFYICTRLRIKGLEAEKKKVH